VNKKLATAIALLITLSIPLTACGAPTPEPTPEPTLKVGVVIDSGTENDKSFNEYTLKGAQKAAEAAGLELSYVGSKSTGDYETNIENLITEEGANLVITVGFRISDATAKAAQRHPDVKFAILDVAYFPGLGCAEHVQDCYTEEGGLASVTSLIFAEDEVAYLAGVLAGCMSETGTVASVAGMEIPPVVRYVTGFQNGARSVNPDIVALNQYIPDFNDLDTGEVVGQTFIGQDADVVFGCGGNTGNGGLLAAKKAGLMAIGVDVDQYLTYPEVQDALLTSAMKNVDVAVAEAVKAFAEGKLTAGIQAADVANGGVGLAPYHDWEDKIPQECKNLVEAAREAIKADPTISGGK